MAKCDEGYNCEVCGRPVEKLTESDLYLRYVIGMLDPEVLHTTPERHVRCNPVLAQFIVHPSFEPLTAAGDFAKSNLDPAFVAEREALATRGYERLLELVQVNLPIVDYPLPEVRAKHAEGRGE
ncbi:hypothetical protein [Blastopirellula marina]|uniref:Uncharacterized protein n=1 Tax=Blastopirellula marina DSM 3645 TaxID=314230 RepID=A3ZUG4_9BACT|nr:hypothetical protein [Blastopirellula marina]EAQ79874.1 hypothetical protein DSM3645_22079 [Blastopirellula marina DSM 3645]